MLRKMLSIVMVFMLLGVGLVCMAEADSVVETDAAEGTAIAGDAAEDSGTDEAGGDKSSEDGETEETEASEPFEPIEATPAPEATVAPESSSHTHSSKKSTESASPAEARSDNLLERGSLGSRVRELQEKLKELGYDVGYIDGSFGPKTEAAVLAYQKDNGLVENGIINESQFTVLLGEKPLEEVVKPIDVEDGVTAKTNLLKNAGSPELGTASIEDGVWRKASNGKGVREVVELAEAPVTGITKGFHIKGSADDGAPTDVGIGFLPLIYGRDYLLSCYVRGSGQVKLMAGKKPWRSVSYSVSDGWERFVFVFRVDDTIGSTEELPENNVYFGVPAKSDSEVFVCGMQLELIEPSAWND